MKADDKQKKAIEVLLKHDFSLEKIRDGIKENGNQVKILFVLHYFCKKIF